MVEVRIRMPEAPAQLVFELPHRPAMGLEDFLVSSSNRAAVDLVDRWPDWPTGAAVLCGPSGSGKTHLANVWRLRSDAIVAEAASVTTDNVAVLARTPAIVIEQVSTLKDEAALFHLLNLVREQRLAILLTSERPPGELEIKLPDLASRLKALPFATILPPDDALLRAVLVKLFADRQLPVEPNVIDFVLVRMERSMAAADRIVRDLDRRALAMRRPVTRALAAKALEDIGS